MIKRTIEISTQAHLAVRRDQLIIKRREQSEASIPIEDIAFVLLAHGEITTTQSVPIICAKFGAQLIFCDDKFQPVALGMPLSGNDLSSKYLSSANYSGRCYTEAPLANGDSGKN